MFDVLGIAMMGVIAGIIASNLQASGTFSFMGLTLPSISNEGLLWIITGVLGLFLVKSVVAILLNRGTTQFLANVETERATNIAAYLFGGDLTAISRYDAGEVTWAAMGSVNVAFTRLLTNFATIISEGTLLILIVGTFFLVDPVASFFVLIYFSVLIAIMLITIERSLKKAGADGAEGNMTSVNVLNDILGAFREISIFNAREYFLSRFRAARHRAARSVATELFLQSLPRYIVETALLLGVVIFVALQLFSGNLEASLVTIGVFLTGGLRIIGSLLPLQNAVAVSRIQVEQSSMAQKLLRLRQDAIRDQREVVPESFETSAKQKFADAALEIELRHVSFRYPDATQNALSDVNITIKPGQHVAVIGPSGAGKTTLIDLVLGLLEPSAGKVLISGKNVQDLERFAPGIVAYVPQKPGVISGTIAENVALGVDPTDIDHQLVHQAIAAAHLTEYVASLPEGINTSVRNQADSLSGGQVQRLGLARALYRKPKLLVLDEATSALDATSEAFITETLASLGREVTVIIIAHRLSTVQHADVVFVVDDGCITASGSFAQLRQTVPMVAEYVRLMSFDDPNA